MFKLFDAICLTSGPSHVLQPRIAFVQRTSRGRCDSKGQQNLSMKDLTHLMFTILSYTPRTIPCRSMKNVLRPVHWSATGSSTLQLGRLTVRRSKQRLSNLGKPFSLHLLDPITSDKAGFDHPQTSVPCPAHLQHIIIGPQTGDLCGMGGLTAADTD